MFKHWSQSNPHILDELRPKIGLNSWDYLTKQDKQNIWNYMARYFFELNPNMSTKTNFHGDQIEIERKKQLIYLTIADINDKYKKNNYTPMFLAIQSLNAACQDFHAIFMDQSENVVFELLSHYCRNLLPRSLDRKPGEPDKSYEIRIKGKLKEFERFANALNDVFGQFGVNVILTRRGFIPRQDKMVSEDIYEPVLSFLSDEKWKPVNNDLSDAFTEYRDKEYTNSITHAISALQAYLHILVHGAIGKGDISKLILQAQEKSLVPNDVFTKRIFHNMDSIFAQEGQEEDAHSKKEYANEATARLILNLAIVFLQHCVQFGNELDA